MNSGFLDKLAAAVGPNGLLRDPAELITYESDALTHLRAIPGAVVLPASAAEVQAVVDHLKTLSLAVESSGGRVMRYAHNVGKVLAIPSQSVALLAALMLRGPQTEGELRINCERLHHFSDTSAVEGFLHELAARNAGAIVVELSRQPGTRETRWAHLLSGPPSSDTVARAAPADGDVVTVSELAALRANVADLRGEIATLKASLAKLCADLGVAPPRDV